jgi:hypothetical protein
LTFARKSGAEEIIAAINMSNTPFFGSIEASGNFEEITPDIAPPLPPDDDKMKAKPKTNAALPVLTLDAFGYRIYRRKN